jgi:hypothetical protein
VRRHDSRTTHRYPESWSVSRGRRCCRPGSSHETRAWRMRVEAAWFERWATGLADVHEPDRLEERPVVLLASVGREVRSNGGNRAQALRRRTPRPRRTCQEPSRRRANAYRLRTSWSGRSCVCEQPGGVEPVDRLTPDVGLGRSKDRTWSTRPARTEASWRDPWQEEMRMMRSHRSWRRERTGRERITALRGSSTRRRGDSVTLRYGCSSSSSRAGTKSEPSGKRRLMPDGGRRPF